MNSTATAAAPAPPTPPLTGRRLAAETALVAGLLAGGLSALVLIARAATRDHFAAVADVPAVADAAFTLARSAAP